MTSSVNTSTFDISIAIVIAGIYVGKFNGNLKDVLVIKVNVISVKGEVRFYLKNENEDWVGLKLRLVFDGRYESEAKIITIWMPRRDG
jgi:hypothetical protein